MVRDRLGERPAAEREHARPLDAAMPDEGHVRRAAADVDEQRAGLLHLLAGQDTGYRVRLGDDLEQLQVELLGDALQGTQVNERRKGVEDADLDVAALEPDRVGDRIAVDLGAGDRSMNQPHVHLRQPCFPGDRPLGLAQGIMLDAVDQLLQLDRPLSGRRGACVRGMRRGEAFDQLSGDPDDALRRPEAGHLLGLLERGRAVVDDRVDVRHRAGLHVGEALALAADAPHGAEPGLVDVEDERLYELGADVQRRAGSQRRLPPRGPRFCARTPRPLP